MPLYVKINEQTADLFQSRFKDKWPMLTQFKLLVILKLSIYCSNGSFLKFTLQKTMLPIKL